MTNQLGSDYSEIAISHWIWILFTIVILISGFLLGGIVGPQLSTTIIQRLLTTLVTSVASVLAIAFSVLFISTQIASDRYSPEFTASFVNDPIVKLIFGMGVTSILSNIIILAFSSSIYKILDTGSKDSVSFVLWSIGGGLVGLSIILFFALVA